MQQPTVLIVSDDAEFSRSITGRWQLERRVPTFTLMSSDVQMGLAPESLLLSIVSRIRPQALSSVLEVLNAVGKRVIFVSDEASALQTVRDRWPGVIAFRQKDDWLDSLIMLASEALCHAEAEARAIRAEKANALLIHEATLGRYMLEMRHSLNNMLTATLGNSELLLLEPGSLSGEARSQIETIHNMALRIHEILRRFSSLEQELNMTEWQGRTESQVRSANPGN